MSMAANFGVNADRTNRLDRFATAFCFLQDRQPCIKDHMICAFCVGKGGGGETGLPDKKYIPSPPGDTEQNVQIMLSATHPAHKLFALNNRQTAATTPQLLEPTAACTPHTPLDRC
jgi:hypothetical protein